MQCYRFFYDIPVENSVRTLSDTMDSRLYQASIECYTNVPVYTDLFSTRIHRSVHGLDFRCLCDLQ